MGRFSAEDRKYLSSKGLCCECGKRPATPGYVSCRTCREKARLRAQARAAKKAAAGGA